MRRLVIPVALLSVMCACSPQPRSSHYFDAHQSQIDPMFAARSTERARGRGCGNVDLATAHRAADRRMRVNQSAFVGN